MHKVEIIYYPEKGSITDDEYEFLQGHLGCHEEPEWHAFMVITDDNGKRCYVQGGEPEDQTFGRDLAWIEEELKLAYVQGLQDGLDCPAGGKTNE